MAQYAAFKGRLVMTTAVPLDEIRKQLIALHSDLGEVLNAATHLHPTLRLSLQRKPLKNLEEQVDQCSRRFVEIDSHYRNLITAPSDMNSAVIQAATWSSHVAARRSVRGLLIASNDILGGIRGRLDVTLSVWLALAAIVITAVLIIAN